MFFFFKAQKNNKTLTQFFFFFLNFPPSPFPFMLECSVKSWWLQKETFSPPLWSRCLQTQSSILTFAAKFGFLHTALSHRDTKHRGKRNLSFDTSVQQCLVTKTCQHQWTSIRLTCIIWRGIIHYDNLKMSTWAGPLSDKCSRSPFWFLLWLTLFNQKGICSHAQSPRSRAASYLEDSNPHCVGRKLSPSDPFHCPPEARSPFAPLSTGRKPCSSLLR